MMIDIDKWKFAIRSMIRLPFMIHICILIIYANITLITSLFIFKDLFCIESLVSSCVGCILTYLMLIRVKAQDYTRIQNNREWAEHVHNMLYEIDELQRIKNERKEGPYINTIDDLYD